MKYRFRRRFLYVLFLFITKVILLFPLRISLAIGKVLGFVAYFLLGREKKIAIDNLKMAFNGEKSPTQINKIAKDVFCNFGICAIEALSMAKIKRQLDKNISSVGFEKIDKALGQGKGVIVLGGHFGSWELMPMYFVAKGYPTNIIARRLYYEKYNEWANLIRKTSGANIIYRDESPRKMLYALKNNEILGIVPDQDIDSIEGVFINFFNRPAYTPIAPVVFAMKLGCPVLPCFIIRENGRHRIVVEDPINMVDTGDKEADMVTNTQAWSSVIESYIRKYPDHWAWMHRRWKTQPKQQP